MRHLYVVAVVLALLATAAGQSLRIDERASRVTLREKTYDIFLLANSTENLKSAVVKLNIVAPTGHQVASSTFAAPLKTGTNKLSTQVSLPELPKRSEDLLWYRLTYSVTANGADLAHGTLPLFESVQDFALHVSAPALVQPGKKFFLRIHTSHPVLRRAIGSVAIKAQVHESDAEIPLASAAGTTDANGYTVLSMSLPADLQARDLEVAVEAQRGTIKKTAENDLKVGAPSRILVQTDKPLYQPGQTLHIRALGTVKTVVLWNPVDLGYLAVYAAQASLADTLKDNATQARVPAGRLGTRDAVATLDDITAKGTLTLKNVIVLGNPFRFTKDNIDQFNF
jgi:hypothetical protein